MDMEGTCVYNCMDKAKIRDFFDDLAPVWDDQLIVYGWKMDRILDAAGVTEGSRVLDVACGTGVMIPFYMRRGAAHVTGIDLSPAMASTCSSNFACYGDRLDVVCGDAETHPFADSYDAVVVFNAFPHFPDPQALVGHLSRCVAPGGTLTIAHDMGRKDLDSHHEGCASEISHGMMHEDDVAALFGADFDMRAVVSEKEIFVVAGTRRMTLRRSGDAAGVPSRQFR